MFRNIAQGGPSTFFYSREKVLRLPSSSVAHSTAVLVYSC